MATSRVAASAVVSGLGIGMAAGVWLSTAPRTGIAGSPAANALCGTYQLESYTSLPIRQKGSHTTLDDTQFYSGVLVYQPDGQMSSCYSSGKKFIGFTGRWWLHNASTNFGASYPPHQGTLVEHEVRSASYAKLVGQRQVQQYCLSEDGQHLTTSSLAVVDGESKRTTTACWRRL